MSMLLLSFELHVLQMRLQKIITHCDTQFACLLLLKINTTSRETTVLNCYETTVLKVVSLQHWTTSHNAMPKENILQLIIRESDKKNFYTQTSPNPSTQPKHIRSHKELRQHNIQLTKQDKNLVIQQSQTIEVSINHQQLLKSKYSSQLFSRIQLQYQQTQSSQAPTLPLTFIDNLWHVYNAPLKLTVDIIWSKMCQPKLVNYLLTSTEAASCKLRTYSYSQERLIVVQLNEITHTLPVPPFSMTISASSDRAFDGNRECLSILGDPTEKSESDQDLMELRRCVVQFELFQITQLLV
eukprot:TRINITY_DN2349_c0_g2_i2.p1 TRINITY_DN2349_c0_g2~~TRINITY_DN2349_c0_g2_i2.p1  ORF type:complete len:297 (+),score=-9.31 TRINITY_DN2349_c0_g2_i2:440-1330(+)